MAAPRGRVETAQVQLAPGRSTYFPPGHAAHPEGAVVRLPAHHAAELVAAGHATHVESPAEAAARLAMAQQAEALARAALESAQQAAPPAA